MDFIEQAAKDGASKALADTLSRVDRDLKTIHEDLADGIESTAERIAELLKPVSEALADLCIEVKTLKTVREIKTAPVTIPKLDLSKIEAKLEALSSTPAVDLSPVLRSLDALANRKPQPTTEEWVFDIERESWSGLNRIETVNAKRVA